MRRTFVPLACAALISSLAQAQSPAPSATTRPDVNVAASAAISPQTASLTLSAAVDTALAQNPQLRAATAELDANDGALRQAGLIPNPVLCVH